MFHVIDKEIRWRNDNGKPRGFGSLSRFRPLVAVGAERPLADQMMMADYFRKSLISDEEQGYADHKDGRRYRWSGWRPHYCSFPPISIIYIPSRTRLTILTKHPHHTSPEKAWETLFEHPPADTLLTSSATKVPEVDPASPTRLFTPSSKPSHLAILEILEDNPVDTVDIIAIGPLTTLALAASHSPQIFLRAKSVVVMGGAIAEPGNITPVGEFNTLADPTAAARVFALTSPTPASTMPPIALGPASPVTGAKHLPPYPPRSQLGDRRLKIVIFPLDITNKHTLRKGDFEKKIANLLEDGSPLADWAHGFLGPTFRRMESLHHGHEGSSTSLSLHDPLCVWYLLTRETQSAKWQLKQAEDIRIETAGQWTRGMCVVDRRDRKTRDDDGEGNGDTGGWLSRSKGNRIDRCISTPGTEALGAFLLDTIFG